ncbi:MAG: hypothetical protein JNM86_05985 [Phycisphaerae bacterium]|nr:hypothetical protein [Phycisphaerae bacterium]MBN8597073.1 hypothetical protein [Planctomycetota bacterium]
MANNDLLRTLSSTILPPGVERRTGQTAPAAVQGQSFAELLAGKASGKLSSDRGVNIRAESGVQLNSDQMARVANAMDKAEAAGAQHALVMIDGMALKVDVGVRQVVEQIDMKQSAVMSGIDTVIHAGDQTASAQKPVMPGAGFHPSLAKILSGDPRAAA